MTLYRTAQPAAVRKKLDIASAQRRTRIIKASQAARSATAALHDAIGLGDPHSKGLTAALAFLAETVAAVVEARQLPPASVRTGKRDR